MARLVSTTMLHLAASLGLLMLLCKMPSSTDHVYGTVINNCYLEITEIYIYKKYVYDTDAHTHIHIKQPINVLLALSREW